MQKNKRLYAAGKAFLVHGCISMCIVFFVAIIVFFVWFPYPYRNLAGGLHLFWIILGVDLVCGPLLTAILFNPSKSKRELRLDLSIVGCIQLIAFIGGFYSIALARPVIVAFEGDRFVVVSAAEVDQQRLQKAPPHLRALSWTGPKFIGVRHAWGGEILQSIEFSLHGVNPSMLPDWWQTYEISVPDIKQRMKNLNNMYVTRSREDQVAIDKAVISTGQSVQQLFYLPLTSRKQMDTWIVLLNAQAQIVGYAPVGGFN